jgi:hypothetical protein
MLEKYGKDAAERASWGGRFGRSLEGAGPDEMHFSMGEGGSLGSVSGAARGSYAGRGGTIANWLAGAGAQASQGMGDDPLKWKSPLNPNAATTETASSGAWPKDAPTEDLNKTLDRLMAKEVSHDVDTSGTITIKHDQKASGPLPSKLPPFKDVPTNRQATMEAAHDGPQAPNPASGV